MDAFDLLEKWESLEDSLEQMIVDSLEEIQIELIEAQSEQLFEGKTSTGQDIKPSYFDDPYFKTKEAAQAYSDWKDDITPNSKRTKGTPNLYINGHLHNNLFVKVDKSGIEYDDAADFFPDVEKKYTQKLLGLTDERNNEIAHGVFWQALKQKLEQKTGLSFGDD